MRLALLSDLHANQQALDACLAHAQGQGVDRCAFLGDLVGYGADPAGVMERVVGKQLETIIRLFGGEAFAETFCPWRHPLLPADALLFYGASVSLHAKLL